MSDHHSPLRLNVGFIAHQDIGYSRDFFFNLPEINLKPDLELVDFTGKITISRTPQGLYLQANLKAATNLECVRCLDNYQQDLVADFAELYAFNQKTVTESGLILPEDGHIDLRPLVRDYMFLEVPINPTCRSDCKGLCLECGNNLNEGPCDHPRPTGDSRFDILKTLLEAE